MQTYRGPDHTRNALTLLRTLAEGPGEGPGGISLDGMGRMAFKTHELGLSAQDPVGKQTRETLFAAIRMAEYFANKYAAATGRKVTDVISETQLEFEASIPDFMEPRPFEGPDN
jgi:hypothetical protein